MAKPAEPVAPPPQRSPLGPPPLTDVGYAPTLPGSRPDPALSPTIDPLDAAPGSDPAQGEYRPNGRSAKGTDHPTSAELALIAVPGAVPAPLQDWERYEILRPLGQGGMGTVFLARDRRLGRQVALKFLRVPSPEAAERMMQEARAQARLDHSGICKVFEVGEFKGQPYIAMEFIDGQPLHLAMRRLTLEQRVFLVHQIALAVHAAHSQGILHRDIKPANIMVCHVDAEAPAEAACGLRPVLMDFGLARDSLGPQRLTQTGVIMGTPHYMAPEQARGQARHLDRRSDVYSLGSVLYELLTGKPPFDAETEVELLLSVLHQDPKPPREIDASIPVDLEIITLKCLRKEPEQRYESALALAEDLLRYLHSEPIVARPASTFYRLRRLAARNRAVVAVVSVILFSLCSFVFFKLRTRERERAAAALAEKHQRLAADLGQANTRISLFLRVAYSLPVHDLRRSQNLLKQHVRELEDQIATTDKPLHGALESAIGQGYLALRDYKKAAEHLERAIANGDQTPGVHLSLGQARGRLYELQLAEVNRQMNSERAKPVIAQLRQTLLLPAKRELEAGRQSEHIPDSYVDALLSFYDEKFDQALAQARAAQEQAPWLIEPLDLETKIITTRHTQRLQRSDESALKESAAVRESIEKAIDTARSYPEFYTSFVNFAVYSVRTALFLNADKDATEAVFNAGVRHAESAILLQPDDAEASDQLADLYASWAYVQALKRMDPEPTIKKGLAVIERVLLGNPVRARPYAVRSRLYLARALYEEHLDQESLASYEQSARDARRASELDPSSSELANLFSVTQGMVAELLRWKGRSGESEDRESLAAILHAVRLRPEVPLLLHNLAETHMRLAQRRIERGLPAGPDLDSARTVVAEIRTKHGGMIGSDLQQLALEQLEIMALLQAGQDATARAQKALELARQQMQTYQKHQEVYLISDKLAVGYSLLTEALMRSGQSPLGVITDGLATLDACDARTLSPGKRLKARTGLLLRQAGWLLDSKQSPEVAVRAVLADTSQLAEQRGAMRTDLLVLRAQALRLRGRFLHEQGRAQQALAAVNEGLALCDEARTTGRGGLLQILAEEGALDSLKARLVRTTAERGQAAARAVSSLTAVLKERPPLGRELEPYLRAAEPLLAAAAPSVEISLHTQLQVR